MSNSTPVAHNSRISTLGVPQEFIRSTPYHITKLLRNQQIYGKSISMKIEKWIETESISKLQCSYYQMPPTTKSAISISFSPDGKIFASTHGDHTVKVIRYRSGQILRTLIGHPRTPWTVKFHPKKSRYIASGCLGFQVRVWDIETGQCLHMATLRHAIISISFHPYGDVLAIASGNALYTWDYQHSNPRIALTSQHTLRCVQFPPNPSQILIGEANDTMHIRRGQFTHSELTVALGIWNFDYAWATTPNATITHVQPITNCQIIIPHSLLYNDGGFDISQCGRYLAACTNYSFIQQLEELNDRQNRNSISLGSSINSHINQNDEESKTNPSNIQSRNFSNEILQSRHSMTTSSSSSSIPENSNSDASSWDSIRRTRPRLYPPVLSSHLRNPLNPNSRLQSSLERNSWLILVSMEPERLGQLYQLSELVGTSVGGVTSVKLSPTGAYVLLGYGVRDRLRNRDSNTWPSHRVTTIYRWEGMKLISYLDSAMDDVNIALFHPFPGHGFLYGTKQGRVRIAGAFLSEERNVNNNFLNN